MLFPFALDFVALKAFFVIAVCLEMSLTPIEENVVLEKVFLNEDDLTVEFLKKIVWNYYHNHDDVNRKSTKEEEKEMIKILQPLFLMMKKEEFLKQKKVIEQELRLFVVQFGWWLVQKDPNPFAAENNLLTPNSTPEPPPSVPSAPVSPSFQLLQQQQPPKRKYEEDEKDEDEEDDKKEENEDEEDNLLFSPKKKRKSDAFSAPVPDPAPIVPLPPVNQQQPARKRKRENETDQSTPPQPTVVSEKSVQNDFNILFSPHKKRKTKYDIERPAPVPTFNPARGGHSIREKPSHPVTQYYIQDLPSYTSLKMRQPGQNNEEEIQKRNLKEELKTAELEHFKNNDKPAHTYNLRPRKQGFNYKWCF